jgi:predicted DNA-binding antitoxin AbrB/MazE fold protein
MTTKTIEATYENGVLRPRFKLPLRERAHVTLILYPHDPVSRTRGMFRVPKRLAKVLIYDDTLLDA